MDQHAKLSDRSRRPSWSMFVAGGPGNVTFLHAMVVRENRRELCSPAYTGSSSFQWQGGALFGRLTGHLYALVAAIRR